MSKTNDTQAIDETPEGTQERTCFTHHVTNFVQEAFSVCLKLVQQS